VRGWRVPQGDLVACESAGDLQLFTFITRAQIKEHQLWARIHDVIGEGGDWNNGFVPSFSAILTLGAAHGRKGIKIGRTDYTRYGNFRSSLFWGFFMVGGRFVC